MGRGASLASPGRLATSSPRCHSTASRQHHAKGRQSKTPPDGLKKAQDRPRNGLNIARRKPQDLWQWRRTPVRWGGTPSTGRARGSSGRPLRNTGASEASGPPRFSCGRASEPGRHPSLSSQGPGARPNSGTRCLWDTTWGQGVPLGHQDEPTSLKLNTLCRPAVLPPSSEYSRGRRMRREPEASIHNGRRLATSGRQPLGTNISNNYLVRWHTCAKLHFKCLVHNQSQQAKCRLKTCQ